MLTLLLVCSFSPKVQKYLLGTPEYRINGAPARRGSVARQRVRQHAESLVQIKKTHRGVSLFGVP